jgi:hypothetical protein
MTRGEQDYIENEPRKRVWREWVEEREREREEKEGGENSPLVRDRQERYWYRVCGTIKLARAGTGTSQYPWWAD